jgi:hypothetical protein
MPDHPAADAAEMPDLPRPAAIFAKKRRLLEIASLGHNCWDIEG